MCQRVSVTLGQRSSNGQKYAGLLFARIWPIHDTIHKQCYNVAMPPRHPVTAMNLTHIYIYFHIYLLIVLCEYSKFRTKSNSYFSVRFDSKRVQLFEIFEYLPSPISHLKKLKEASFLTEWRRFFTLATMPSNQQNQCYICLLYTSDAADE